MGYVTSPQKKWSYQVGPYFELVFLVAHLAKRKEKAKSFQEDLRPAGDAALSGWSPFGFPYAGFGLWVKRVQQKH